MSALSHRLPRFVKVAAKLLCVEIYILAGHDEGDRIVHKHDLVLAVSCAVPVTKQLDGFDLLQLAIDRQIQSLCQGISAASIYIKSFAMQKCFEHDRRFGGGLGGALKTYYIAPYRNFKTFTTTRTGSHLIPHLL